jgi:hypothetical protein
VQDTHEFIVKTNGRFSAVGNLAQPGAETSTKAAEIYLKDKGTPQSYFGRGYVQLT